MEGIKNQAQAIATIVMEKVIIEQKYARLKGEYIGSLKGILCWDIPNELRDRIESLVQDLKNA